MHDGLPTLSVVEPVSPDEGAEPAPAAAVDGPAASPDSRAQWRFCLRTGLWTWLLGIGGYALLTIFSSLPFFTVRSPAGTEPTSLGGAIARWQQWDVSWYIAIATHGYGTDPWRAPAFFPVYPILLRVFDVVIPGRTLIAALLLSSLCALVALVLMCRLALDILGPAAADANRAVVYLLAFPTGFYLVNGYNESLFMALALGSLLLMRRGHWWWAGLVAGVASGTRLSGLLLGAAFAVEYVRQHGGFRRPLRGLRWDVLGIALVPAGVVAFSIYCGVRFHDPLAFSTVQSAWLRDGFHFPWVAVHMSGSLILDGPPLGHDTLHNAINLGAAFGTAALLILAVFGRWRLGPQGFYLVVFAALSLMLPLCTPIKTTYPIASLSRYVLECVPMFLVLAKMGRSERFHQSYLLAVIIMQVLMVEAVLHGQFIA
jgi:Mannosyltransferase (PIG-V)